MKGLVIKNTGSWYQVKTDDGQFIECKIKGNFRLKGIRSTNPVAVGDRVQIILNQEGTAFINEIEDRKNYIIRRSSNLSKQSHILAANLDQCMLVVTVNYPETSTIFIDRFLASAEAYRVPVKLVFNKVDAYNEEELHYLDALINLYTHIGYPCFKVSAKDGTLQDGDRLLVLNAMLDNDYEYGDIVVLRKDTFLEEPIVKRVIATEGQTVDIDFVSGAVYVDGELLEEDYINEPTYVEEGTEFPLTVPEGSIFVMGDNRNHSSDSRSSDLGTVDTRYVIGKAVFLLFPGADEATGQRDFGRIGPIAGID